MKETVQTVIVDIDGTLADMTHRIHHVKNGNHDWDSFFAGVSGDAPIWPICNLVGVLWQHYKIVLVSGRSDKTRADTEEWLNVNGVPYHDLFMRADGDYRPDY